MTNPDNSSYGGLCPRCREIECTDECMTNPDKVGGLPAKWREQAENAYTQPRREAFEECANDLEAELCRAAPAGGDYHGAIPQALDETINGVVSDLQMIAAGKDQVTGDPVSGLQSQRIAKSAHDRLLSAWNACDSAPAGSGEVDYEFANDLAQEIRRVDGSHSLSASALADAITPFILRKLQQGADYVVVPRVSTEKMRRVGVARYQEFSDEGCYTAEGERQQMQAVWTAMIGAASQDQEGE